ncbi:valine--tRNA ligase [Patescibacteria group bacterium]|nr:valine--tRNA ligase [Patescibacteria group bacterium]
MVRELPKNFEHQKAELDIYQIWEKSGLFSPATDSKKKPYVITMPPPNAYDQLHIGHALFVAIEDIMVRYHRLKGEPTLWLPGADHAGIASQVFFEKNLKEKEGLTRHDLGREEFVKRLFEFVMNKREIMEGQLRRLGASCDWSRKKFTLDDDVSYAVRHTFKKLYDDGLLYRGERVINWCPRCATFLSDLEVDHKEKDGVLIYIKYPIKDSKEYIIVATTRPETMLGDTAVAVNPKDPRYKKLVGKIVVLPIMGREIPIIADEYVAMDFGTGAVKITPAHDLNDFDVGQRHKLENISVVGPDLVMTAAAGKFAGIKSKDASVAIVEELEHAGLIEKTTPYRNAVSICERCKATLEPLISKQWFIKINALAGPAIKAVEEGKIKFVPARFKKVYMNWMENIHDWNISRQLWWGHRIPVYYCDNNPEHFTVSVDSVDKCPTCDGTIHQDEDTLDTWFSSGQWPFTTLGWPKKTNDFERYYPTTVMETGWDILFFWVARMIMMGLYCTGEIPFKLVYLNGLVRDKTGAKISKSKGNVIDPIEMIDKYGSDALRLGLLGGMAPGNDSVISEDKIRGYRNFANKIWNAARFVQMSAPELKDISTVLLQPEDKTTIDQFHQVVKQVTSHMDKYRLAQAGELLYEYFWHQFCDKYIESAKTRLNTDGSAEATLHHILKNCLIMLHPFVPFVSEAVWQNLYQQTLLLGEKWPTV